MRSLPGPPRSLVLEVVPGELAICRLPPDAAVPAWGAGGGVTAAIRTPDSLTLMVPAPRVPAETDSSRGWRALRVAGVFAFSEVGVIVAVAAPLAAAGVSIMPLATYETDYVLVRDEQLALALATLRNAGHRVHETHPMPRSDA